MHAHAVEGPLCQLHQSCMHVLQATALSTTYLEDFGHESTRVHPMVALERVCDLTGRSENLNTCRSAPLQAVAARTTYSPRVQKIVNGQKPIFFQSWFQRRMFAQSNGTEGIVKICKENVKTIVQCVESKSISRSICVPRPENCWMMGCFLACRDLQTSVAVKWAEFFWWRGVDASQPLASMSQMCEIWKL